MTGLGNLIGENLTVTGLGKCGNVIGELPHGEAFGNCGNVIGELLDNDWPWQLWKCYWARTYTVTGLGNVICELPHALANVEMLSVRTYTVTGLGNVRFHKELPWLFHLVLEKWLMCYRCCRDI